MACTAEPATENSPSRYTVPPRAGICSDCVEMRRLKPCFGDLKPSPIGGLSLSAKVPALERLRKFGAQLRIVSELDPVKIHRRRRIEVAERTQLVSKTELYWRRSRNTSKVA